jgi:predicted GNAT superfamily acetyltransferase
MEFKIRELSSLKDFQDCVQMQKDVWGFDDPFDAVPLPLLIVSKRNDGVVLGAFEGSKMIGFVYSMPGTHQGVALQWSHMLAVMPEYQNSDIGYQLKMAQYRISAEKGYRVIEWTYDPLESRNANFNLRKLGCIAKEYEINIYGETSSPLHQGSPTDRLVAHWPIPSLEKNEKWDTIPAPPLLITEANRVDEDLLTIENINLNSREPFLFMEIPVNMQKLKSKSPEAALAWRMKTRELFLHYLEAGYVVYNFLHWKDSSPPRSFYVLKRM